MSLNGLNQFDKNLRAMLEADVFQKANTEEKFELSYKLLNSKYGLGFTGKVKKLIFLKEK